MTHKLMVDKEFMRLIPPLLEEEYRQLEQNILAKGKLLNPILLWDGKIVDGHNRFYICMAHKIEFEVKEMYFDSREEATLWILENQLGRRNLTDAARIALALRKKELLREMAKENQSRAGGDKYGNETLFTKGSTKGETPVNVHKTLAKEARVGHGTLQRYDRIMKEGSPALIEAVQSGRLKIGTAHRMLPREIEKQLKKADKMYEYIRKYLPTITDEWEKEDVRRQLLGLREQLVELIERRKTYEDKNNHN